MTDKQITDDIKYFNQCKKLQLFIVTHNKYECFSNHLRDFEFSILRLVGLYNKNLCNEQFDELTRLKKENKKLKKEIKDWQKEVERVQFIGSYGIMDEVKKNTQLKQTLAEIKEIAEEKAKVNDWLALDILQKINEVEDDRT